jgi:hypothetical protein
MRDDIVAMGNAPAVIAATCASSPPLSRPAAPAADSQLQQFYDRRQAAGSNPGVDLQHASGNACRSGYAQAHAENDGFFRKRHAAYGWYDMLLVDSKGNVVYSLRKDNDFATNLLHGPWKDTGLARAATIALNRA